MKAINYKEGVNDLMGKKVIPCKYDVVIFYRD